MGMVDEFISVVKDGYHGLNKGIPLSINALNKTIHGVRKKSFCVIGGDSGSGKSSLAIDLYVDSLMRYKEIFPDFDFGITYYSLELSEDVLMAKILSLYIFRKYGVDLSYSKIMSFDEKIDDKSVELIMQSMPYLELVAKHLRVVKKVSAESYYQDQCNEYSKYGVLDLKNDKYTPHNPQRLNVSILDHVSLITNSGGRKKKEEIELITNHTIYLRDCCKGAYLFVQQLNRNASESGRRKGEEVEIEFQDFRDSADTTNGADIVLAFFFPHRMRLSTARGYTLYNDPVNGCGFNTFSSRFRTIQVLKNRFGTAGLHIPCAFYGEIGKTKQIPHLKDMMSQASYDRIVPISYLHN